MRTKNLLIVLTFINVNCTQIGNRDPNKSVSLPTPYIVVLGIAQDAGYPQAGCHKKCCNLYYSGKARKHYVSCLAIVDPAAHKRWIFDATPDFGYQLHYLDSIAPAQDTLLNGIFLTHAHIGHYTGLMYLGREAMNTSHVPVYAMPRMKDFITENGPWSQLVSLGNIDLKSLKQDSAITVSDGIHIMPFTVPHRNEYSETVGYKIYNNKRSVIFIPDINKWNEWNKDILKVIQENDLLFLDGTFFKSDELPGGRMNKVPHPFIEESMKIFSKFSVQDRNKVYFIHFNHTNPVIYGDSATISEISTQHFHIAEEGMMFPLR